MSSYLEEHERTREFGKPENIQKRLAMWAAGLGADKRYPWVGLGLIDDLKCACRMLGGDPDKTYPDMRSKPAPALSINEPSTETKYDL